MVKPVAMFFIALAHAVGFISLNLYPIVRLRVEGTWGSSGTGFVSGYGFPLEVGVSQGCFTGPMYHYDNLALNLLACNGAALALFALPFLATVVVPRLSVRARIFWKVFVENIASAFNYGAPVPREPGS